MGSYLTGSYHLESGNYKRIGINHQAQKKGSTATPRISCAVNYPENLQSVLNHAPNSEITLFKALIKDAFSSRFPTVTRMQFFIRGGLFRFFTKIPAAVRFAYMRSESKMQLK